MIAVRVSLLAASVALVACATAGHPPPQLTKRDLEWVRRPTSVLTNPESRGPSTMPLSPADQP